MIIFGGKGGVYTNTKRRSKVINVNNWIRGAGSMGHGKWKGERIEVRKERMSEVSSEEKVYGWQRERLWCWCSGLNIEAAPPRLSCFRSNRLHERRIAMKDVLWLCKI